MIVFDLQAVQSAAHGERGIARYVSDLATTLAARHPDVVDVFAWNDQLPEVSRLAELGLGDRLQPFSAIRGRHVDVLHVNSVFEPLMYGEVGVPVRADRLVTTCYDLIPYRFLDQYLVDERRAAAYRARLMLLASADAVVTDSQSAADDVRQLVGVPPERLTVIGAGVGERFAPPTLPLTERIEHLRRRFPALSARYVFVPTGIDWRKNIPGAIAAFGRLPTDVGRSRQLVLSCRVDDGQRAWIDALAGAAGVTDRVLVTGYVSDDDLVMLYQSAEVVMFPSFYEGFGLPVLEARRCGARVISSDASSLPEVLVDPAARFDPHDVDAMSGVLARALDDPGFAAALERIVDPGFTWDVASDRLVEVYRSLRPLRPRATVAEAGRRRLALVTLLPPAPSGVADHSARLAAALGDDLDVTVFVTGASAVAAGDRFDVAELAELPSRWLAGEFDRILYCFGNNPLHRDMFQMLQVVPGSVLLHDVRLSGIFDLWYRHRFETDRYADDERSQALLARPVAELATSVLVQSAHAAALVAREAPHRQVFDVGPHPCRVVPAHDRPVPCDSGPPWVLTVGIASTTKRTDLFVAAMRSLVTAGTARAAVVGPDGERFATHADGIDVTGRVDDATFDAWLARAAVLVQLREHTNGESSGVVAHALAFGIPLIVTDIGAMSELPDDVAVKVPVDVGADELSAVVHDLLADHDRRARMSRAALAYAARETPNAQARRVVAALFG